jgi:hypothetical protein
LIDPNAAGGAAGVGQVAAAQIGRATSAEASPGLTPGGGTDQPVRAAAGSFVADAKADLPQMASGPQPAGGPVGSPLEVASTATGRQASGLPGKATSDAVGAIAGEVPVDSPVGQAGLTPGAKAAAGGAGEIGPTPVAGEATASLARTESGGAAAGIDADAVAPALAGGLPTGSAAEPTLGVQVGAPARKSGGIPVQVAAAPGVGGLGTEVTVQAGSLSPRSSRDAEVVHIGDARFLAKAAGGTLAIDGRARDRAQSFGGRGRSPTGGGPRGGGTKTEAAVESGLEFLAKHQSADGSWSLNNFPGASVPRSKTDVNYDAGAIHSDTAATGLALLAFLGAGYDHFEDRYQHNVKNALAWLMQRQKVNGDLYVATDPKSSESAWLYSHAIATIALCEAVGMTGDEQLRVPAQKAIDFIVATQHPQRGGWRYSPTPGHDGFDTDTSVTGWQLMALKSGELAGLNVPSSCYDKIRAWLDVSQASKTDGSRYSYNPYAPDTQARRAGRTPNSTMTSVGLLMRMYTGWNRENPQLARGAEYLRQNLPEIGSRNDPKRDTYYWYYATQVMFHMKGDLWKAWNDRLHPMLVNSQVKQGRTAGSWDPNGNIADRWGPHGGRIYVTTMNLLSLEVTYRHLPIYEETAK